MSLFAEKELCSPRGPEHSPGGYRPCQRVDSVDWTAVDLVHGKLVEFMGFPKDRRMRVFRVEVSAHCTDWVVTNSLTQDSTESTQEGAGFRWKIVQLYREG